MKITMYSTHTCGYCKMLMGYFKDKNVEYEVKYADDNPAFAQELMQKSGQLGVPFTIFEDDKGQAKGVLGFDKPQIDGILAGS